MKEKAVFKSEKGRDEILAVYDTLLKRWPVPYNTREIATRCGNTFALTCGDPAAAPLVLLHGSTSNSAMWIGDSVVYSRHFRVIALDIPGEPGKSAPVRTALAGPGYVDWMEDVFSALGLEKAALEGISLGGWLALKFAAAHPERVSRLVLLCPAGVVTQKMSFLLAAIALSPFGGWGRERLVRRVYGRQTVVREAVAYSKLIGAHFNPRMEVIPLFSGEELRRLDMPVLLIAGEKDALLPSKKTAARLESLLPRLTVHLLPGSGHVILDQAGSVADFLTASE